MNTKLTTQYSGITTPRQTHGPKPGIPLPRQHPAKGSLLASHGSKRIDRGMGIWDMDSQTLQHTSLLGSRQKPGFAGAPMRLALGVAVALTLAGHPLPASAAIVTLQQG
jgi:hypothetical protein